MYPYLNLCYHIFIPVYNLMIGIGIIIGILVIDFQNKKKYLVNLKLTCIFQ